MPRERYKCSFYSEPFAEFSCLAESRKEAAIKFLKKAKKNNRLKQDRIAVYFVVRHSMAFGEELEIIAVFDYKQEGKGFVLTECPGSFTMEEV